MAGLVGKGVGVFYVEEDAEERGIGNVKNLVAGVSAVRREDVPALFERYNQVWHW